jgi:hypothetical protein
MTQTGNCRFPTDIFAFAPFYGRISTIDQAIFIWPSPMGPVGIVVCLSQSWEQADTHTNPKPFFHYKLLSIIFCN